MHRYTTGVLNLLYIGTSTVALFLLKWGILYIKTAIKGAIASSHHFNIKPQEVKNLELYKYNIKDYIDEMEKVGYAAKLEKSAADYIISHSHINEIYSIPESVFNITKPKIELAHYYQDHNTRLKSLYLSVKLSRMVSTNFTSSIIAGDGYLMNKYLARSLKQHASHIKNGVFWVENVFGFVQQVIKTKALIAHFGKSSITDKKVGSIIDHFLNNKVAFSDFDRGLYHSFRKFMNYRKDKLYFMYLKEVIKKEISTRLSTLTATKYPNDTIQWLIKNEKKTDLETDYIYYTLYSMVILDVTLLTVHISNFIISISIYPEVYSKLAHEQKHIIGKYGNCITPELLDKMEYLDASMTESIRLAFGAGTVRKVDQAYVLSNGISFERGSLIKISGFIYNRTSKLHGENLHDYYPERHIKSGTKLSEISLKSLTWGLGARKCPARQYSVMQMKLFAAIFIRRYEVSQEERFISSGHEGYNFSEHIFHANSSIYLRPHNISFYKTVFKSS